MYRVYHTLLYQWPLLRYDAYAYIRGRCEERTSITALFDYHGEETALCFGEQQGRRWHLYRSMLCVREDFGTLSYALRFREHMEDFGGIFSYALWFREHREPVEDCCTFSYIVVQGTQGRLRYL